MLHVRRAVACCGALTVALVSLAGLSSTGAASAADPASKSTADAAIAWLETQQQPDGGFEVAQFPGFETRDAALAIAEDAQTGSTWSTSQALAAVQALKVGGSGPTPLDYLEQDTAVIGAGGSAAKTIVLTTAPLGLDPTAFGSFGNPAAPVNLVTLMGGCSASTDSTFNGLLYILLAEQLECGAISSAGVAAVRAAQQANGGFNFIGDQTGTDIDLDTSALAVEVLVADGADATDTVVKNALAFFAANHQASGAWQFFGSDDPNSTSLAILGITAAGFDADSPCWRDTVDPASAGTAYASPSAWLRSQQLTAPPEDAGRIASPSDSFGTNTFPTSQTVEGLLRLWLPVARAASQTCEGPVAPPVNPLSPGGTIVPAAITLVPHFTG
jgi:hypothetical protein